MIRRTITIAIALALLVGPAVAQQQTFRNELGQITGSSSTSGNVTTFRDRSGRITGVTPGALWSQQVSPMPAGLAQKYFNRSPSTVSCRPQVKIYSLGWGQTPWRPRGPEMDD